MILVENIGEVRKFRLSRTLFGRGLYYTAAYWVDGLMIDTGCAHTVQDLLSATDEINVDLIVNTHSHEDHIGANSALTSRFGAKIKTHPLALPVMASPRKQQPLKPYQRIMWGYPAASLGTDIADTIATDRYQFQVLHTPGHSSDHICLFEPDQGWLFTGDAFVGGRDQALRADYNIWQIIRSLKKLAKLNARLLFTGSGSVRENAHSDLSEKMHYLEDTAERALDLHRRGMSYGRIRRILFGRELPISYLTLGHFSGKNLVRSFVEDHPAFNSYD